MPMALPPPKLLPRAKIVSSKSPTRLLKNKGRKRERKEHFLSTNTGL